MIGRRSRLAEELSERLRAFSDVARLINAEADLGDVLDAVAEVTSRLLGTPLVFTALAEPDGTFTLAESGHAGLSEYFSEMFRTTPGEGLHHHAIIAGGPIACRDIFADPRSVNIAIRTGGWRAEIVAPLLAGERVVGILCAGGLEPRDWQPEEVEVFRFLATQAAAAIDRARTLENLRALDRLKDEILSIASHELRTPLTAIKGFAAILSSDQGSLQADAVRSYARIIDVESDRMIRLVEDMLNVSRIESGRVELEMGAVDVGEVVERALFMSWGTDRERIHLEIQGDLEVRADSDNLVRILTNLLENARKYSELSARVSVTARAAGPNVEIRVWNEGETITSGEIDQLFRKFSRLHRHRAAGTRGAGLGLYIARQLVAAMGGRLWGEPTTGGPTFAFSLQATSSASSGAPREDGSGPILKTE